MDFKWWRIYYGGIAAKIVAINQDITSADNSITVNGSADQASNQTNQTNDNKTIITSNSQSNQTDNGTSPPVPADNGTNPADVNPISYEEMQSITGMWIGSLVKILKKYGKPIVDWLGRYLTVQWIWKNGHWALRTFWDWSWRNAIICPCWWLLR